MADIQEVAFATSTSDVTVTTTTETVAVTSLPALLPRQTHHVLVIAWCQLTTGAGTTAVTPRIRRGSDTSGDLVGDAVSEAVKAAAGSSEPFMLVASEERASEESVRYSLTVTQADATGDGTVTQAGIIVFVT